MSTSSTTFLEKYTTIIAEEVNVKKVDLLPDDVQVTMTYVPLGNKLGGVYGKDTNSIITAAKQGQATRHEDGSLTVTQEDHSWTLTPDMYEIRYSGLQGDHQTVEGGVVISLDTNITESLKQEGTAREISRFLNQMRKDAGCTIDQKVSIRYTTPDSSMHDLIQLHAPMLREEALVDNILPNDAQEQGYTATYESPEGSIVFVLIS